MQNFGPQTLTIGSQAKYFTGVGWEYLTIGNESPYILDANFSGIGSITIPAWSQEDVRIPSGYTGQLVFTPNNYLGLTQIVSQLVYVNGWGSGELGQRQSYSLSQNFGNIVTSTATNLVNDGNVAGTTIIESTQLGSTGSNVLIKNNGQVTISQFAGGTLTQLLAIIPGVTAGPLNANVIIGDASHATNINGTLQVFGLLWAYDGIATQTSGGNLTGINVNMSGTSTQNGVVVTPQTGTRNFTDFFASGAENNSFGIGYLANTVLVGFSSQSNQTGLQFTGLHSTAGIDLSGLTVSGGGPAIIMPALPMKAATSSDLLLDVTTSGNAIRERIAGVDVLAILSTIINASQQFAPNAAAFSTANGSVSGTVSLFAAVWGSGLKLGIVQWLSNFQTATAVTLLFPSSITFGYFYAGTVGGSTTCQFNNGGSAAAMRQFLTLGAVNTAGTDGSCTNFHGLNFGQFGTSDRFIINTTGGANINSFSWFIGQ